MLEVRARESRRLLLKIPEVAEMLSLAPSYVWRLTQNGTCLSYELAGPFGCERLTWTSSLMSGAKMQLHNNAPDPAGKQMSDALVHPIE